MQGRISSVLGMSNVVHSRKTCDTNCFGSHYQLRKLSSINGRNQMMLICLKSLMVLFLWHGNTLLMTHFKNLTSWQPA